MILKFRVLIATMLIVLLSQCQSTNKFVSDIEKLEHTPWTNLDFKNPSANYNFAIVSDRSGGTRHGIFHEAVLKLNDLNPSFVMSIGDLIDTRDLKLDTTYNEDVVSKEKWSEFNGIVNQLKVPFFYTVGNNDIRNEKWKTYWTEQFGPTYYSFKYYNHLFMVLDSEDSPDNGNRGISNRQLNWLKATLQKNRSVKWTFLFLHKPLWQEEGNEPWAAIENLIKDRPITAFAGHRHTYNKSVKNGNSYYALATTGGSSSLEGIEQGKFDHIMWVSVGEDGPTICNLVLNGILDDDPSQKATQKDY